MNFYEELGVSRDAAAEEIRRAYRQQARLCHPDSQPDDPKLRAFAEARMKRLNAIIAILSDPQKRTQYDETLAPPDAPVSLAIDPPAQHWTSKMLQAAVRQWFWVLLGMIVGGSGLGYFAGRSRPPVVEFTRLPVYTSDPEKHDVLQRRGPITAPPSARRSPTRELRDVPAPVERRPAPSPAALPISPAPAAAVAEKAGKEPVLVAESAVSSAPPERKPEGFSGKWFYVPPAKPAVERGFYPPIYIELQLAEDGGVLAGNYRALYNVGDQAISPEVRFQVRGAAAAGTSVTLGWETGSGATGQAEFTLHSPNSLHMRWWTTNFDRWPVLGSGSAVLTRQLTE